MESPGRPQPPITQTFVLHWCLPHADAPSVLFLNTSARAPPLA
ncbi:MAG: hypothetical protein SFU56_03150 [Capsulimonadales bacterium]|nr:hypothetical protein [Capsulimonadales bacterium]